MIDGYNFTDFRSQDRRVWGLSMADALELRSMRTLSWLILQIQSTVNGGW